MRKFHLIAALLLAAPIAGCGDSGTESAEHGAEAAAGEYERGPHNGRILRDGDFAIEMTVFEDGVPPEYRLYAYKGDEPVAPATVDAKVTIKRLDGEVTTFAFKPQDDFLRGQGVLVEPHSFDVAVTATEGGQTHKWQFESYEGRVTISDDAAAAAGITTETVGPQQIGETVELIGRVEIDPSGSADVGAKFPGPVVSVHRNVGDSVARGTLLAKVESSYSLQTYSIYAPIAGIITQRNVNVGTIAGESPLFVIANPSRAVAAFPVFPRDMESVRPGQSVQISGLEGRRTQGSQIRDFLPLADMGSQSITARAALPNRDGYWKPGMAVRGVVTIDQREVPLAVRTDAIQQFRDFRVVFAKIGETYEVRMLELGQEGPEWTEVLGGIKPGTVYAADNSYVIKADIEKSGASHDH
ncbi:efflux RND transporter periplasmic adaptor subunit [Croceicoccus gelatinilyticus]|uniref:efflux RND transporter periplasmic adaptor subunit n=1 Tax=Croceicoccus gelatinilyticus TaxID=2835536 RepID=UPI001BCD8C5F|nr:efflux RND transporter periplasmic adaptor subunit [Croceicoccus gelatinilyticus]MBS7670958.1 efflux RND transporter periplasmic adaptor subunit [Croceicoccus gelatinilyticus]